MQYNAHETWSAPVGLNVVCLCLHLKKGKDHFDTFNANFIFAQFLIILQLCKKGTQQTDAMSSIFDYACATR